MRVAAFAKVAAWTAIPIALAEPIASVIFDGGLFGLDEVINLVLPRDLAAYIVPPAKLSVAQALTSVPTYLWYYPTSPGVAFNAVISSGIALAIVAIPAGYLAWAVLRRRRRLAAAGWGRKAKEPERAASSAHGNADWMSMEEAHDVFPGEHPDWGGIPIAEGYRPDLDRITSLPFDENDPETWGQGGRAPLLLSPLTTGAISGIIIAGSGARKTTAFTLTAMCTWRGSAVVLDPSRQVGHMVASLREDMGHKVALLDPRSPVDGFNVLEVIDLTNPMATEHMIEVIDWCMPEPADGQTDSKNGKFFAEKARELGVCILADILYDENLPKSKRTLREWRRRIVTPEREMKELLANIYANSASHFARDLAGTLMEQYKETFSSIYGHLTGHTRWLSNPAFASLLSDNTFNPSDITRGKLTVIIQVPDDVMKTTPAVARVIIGALARTVMRVEGRVATPVPFILDEVDLLANMPILAIARDLGRKSGIALFPMWQSIGQIEKTWGQEGKKAWYASAAWRLYAMVNDEATAEEVSKRCGTYTMLSRSEGRSSSQQGAFSTGPRTWSSNDNVSEQRRDLISPYEVQTSLREDEAIIIPRGRRALRCGRPLYYRRPDMERRIEADRFLRTTEKASA
jgi:type IV secretion system protein VirD4